MSGHNPDHTYDRAYVLLMAAGIGYAPAAGFAWLVGAPEPFLMSVTILYYGLWICLGFFPFVTWTLIQHWRMS